MKLIKDKWYQLCKHFHPIVKSLKRLSSFFPYQVYFLELRHILWRFKHKRFTFFGVWWSLHYHFGIHDLLHPDQAPVLVFLFRPLPWKQFTTLDQTSSTKNLPVRLQTETLNRRNGKGEWDTTLRLPVKSNIGRGVKTRDTRATSKIS